MFTLACFLLFGPPPTETLDDLRRFPGHDLATAKYLFASQHHQWVVACQRTSATAREWWWYYEWGHDCQRCVEVWSLLYWATDSARTMRDRLWYLRRLRSELGERAWWAGEMWPEVPVWRFCRK